MRYLTLNEALELHRRIIEQSGGPNWHPRYWLAGIGPGEPLMTFGGEDLYPTLVAKAAALCFSLVKNHPFIDGNKRVAHAVMETFLVLNGYEISAGDQEQEHVILGLAASTLDRKPFADWLRLHLIEVTT